jgi:hypothetical protein
MNQPLSYFDLIVEIVRGRTPIPEHHNRVVDRSDLASTHLKTLKEKKTFSGRDTILKLVLNASPKFLSDAWAKMSPHALTMCGDKSLEQLKDALHTVHLEKIPGDFIEAGVWRGGIPIIMRAFLQSVGDKERTVWLADSFKGLPQETQDAKDKLANLLLEPLGHLSASRKQVESSFEFFGLKDQQVKFLEGWFSDTLKTMPDLPLAIVRLDGDYYESTRDSLEALYPKLSPGGFLIVDDYNLPLGCKKAVNEYRKKFDITEPIIKINNQAVFWRKRA